MTRKGLYFLRRVKRFLRQNISVHSAKVYFRKSNLNGLPPLPDISPLFVKEMSLDNELHIREWLNIMNQAFPGHWQKQNYVDSITNHKFYDVLHTYFLMDGEKYVGVVSEAVFRRNPEVGVTHYLGLDTNYSGRGLGKYLILYVLHKMKSRVDINSCEGETTLNYRISLFIHFDFGFCPKMKADYWNTPNTASILMKALANYKLNFLYKKRLQKRQSC